MAVKDDIRPEGDKPKEKDGKGKDGKKKDEDKEPELSEEDLELKKNLDLMVERVADPDPGVWLSASAMHGAFKTVAAS